MLHNEPAARCFQDEQGRSVVDYVIRYESLQEDFTELMAVSEPADGFFLCLHSLTFNLNP